jgi:predicted RNase H-like HicB family nuclease
MRTLEEYLALPYTIEIVQDHDDDGHAGYVAEVKELPGVISQGETVEEAATNVHDAMAGWISVALEDGIEIPEPVDVDAYSGRFLLRIPRSLHADLARRAEEEGVSLNQFVAITLARVAGSRRSRELV